MHHYVRPAAKGKQSEQEREQERHPDKSFLIFHGLVYPGRAVIYLNSIKRAADDFVRSRGGARDGDSVARPVAA